MNKKQKNTFKQVESEEEYWREHKKMKKRIGKFFRKSYKYITRPKDFLDKFENILAEYEFKGVISKEWSQEQRERLYKELRSPEEFREWVVRGKDNIKKKLTRQGKKVDVDKAEKKHRKKINKMLDEREKANEEKRK